jgi:hypothetical protein
LVGFVGFEAVKRIAVFVSVNGYGTYAKLGSGSEYPNGNFATIGYKKFL